MAIQKEIWMAAIVEGLFASNSFLSKAFNADEYVNNGKIVHIPNAGAASGTKKNRTELPAKVTKRTDIDVTFPLDEYTTDPVLIPNADTVELSYDKRESVLRQDKLKLQDDVALPPPHSALKPPVRRLMLTQIRPPVSAKVSARQTCWA